MSEIDEAKKRIAKRKQGKPLTDRHFQLLYNAMIRLMVVMLVVVTSLIVVKNEEITDYVLNNHYVKSVIDSVSSTLLSYLPDDSQVSQEVLYRHVEDHYYQSDSNQVIAMSAGKVIEKDENETLGQYIVVLDQHEVEVTYGHLRHIDVDRLDDIQSGEVLGNYQDQLILEFCYLGNTIDYQTYQGMIS